MLGWSVSLVLAFATMRGDPLGCPSKLARLEAQLAQKPAVQESIESPAGRRLFEGGGGYRRSPVDPNELIKNWAPELLGQTSKTFLDRSHFAAGTYRITEPGYYQLTENIIFEPNSQEVRNGVKTFTPSGFGAYSGKAYVLGFFAAITVEARDVVIDLGGFKLAQSPAHKLQQRFFSLIELASSPFRPKLTGTCPHAVDGDSSQGPADFGGADELRKAHNVIVRNGVLCNTSHYGIHGNDPTNVLLERLDIHSFEVGGISMNGAHNLVIRNVEVHSNDMHVPVKSTYSQARNMAKVLDGVIAARPNAMWRGFTGQQIKDRLTAEMDTTYHEVLAGAPVTSGLFSNGIGPIDGCVSGIVLHGTGVAIHGFPDKPAALPARAAALQNVTVRNLSAPCTEMPGLILTHKSEGATADAASDGLSYGAGVQTGPHGSALRVFPELLGGGDNLYSERANVLSEAQFFIGKFQGSASSLPKSKISSALLAWAAGNRTWASLEDEYKVTRLRGGDSMMHVMKGNMGVYLAGQVDVLVEGFNITNIRNTGTTEPPSPPSGPAQSSCPADFADVPFNYVCRAADGTKPPHGPHRGVPGVDGIATYFGSNTNAADCLKLCSTLPAGCCESSDFKESWGHCSHYKDGIRVYSHGHWDTKSTMCDPAPPSMPPPPMPPSQPAGSTSEDEMIPSMNEKRYIANDAAGVVVAGSLNVKLQGPAIISGISSTQGVAKDVAYAGSWLHHTVVIENVNMGQDDRHQCLAD